jgi:ABC-type multidrug transport system fused ATPase/permease subunit
LANIDNAQIQTTSYQFFFVAGVAGICSFFQTSMFLFVGEHLAERIRRAAFRSITRQEIAYFDEVCVAHDCL